MTFPEIAIEAAKRGLSIRINPYGEGVGVYVVTASGHEFAKGASDAESLTRVLDAIPAVFEKAEQEEAKGPPDIFTSENVSCSATAGLNLLHDPSPDKPKAIVCRGVDLERSRRLMNAPIASGEPT